MSNRQRNRKQLQRRKPDKTWRVGDRVRDGRIEKERGNKYQYRNLPDDNIEHLIFEVSVNQEVDPQRCVHPRVEAEIAANHQW